MTSFREFLTMYEMITLNTNLVWRTYDIVSHIKERHVRSALKVLGFGYAGELALPEVQARYALGRRMAWELLGAWWLLTQLEAGRHMKVPLRGSRAGYPTGEAPTPA